MKRIVKVLLILVIMLIPISIKAEDTNIEVSCQKNKLNAGETTTCTLYGKNVSNIIAIKGMIKVSSNLTLGPITGADGWTENVVDYADEFDLTTSSAKSNRFEIVSFNVKAKSGVNGADENIIVEGMMQTNNTNILMTYPNETPIRINSSINTLKSIVIDINGTKPEFTFDPKVNNYNIIYDVYEQFGMVTANIGIVPEDETSSYFIRNSQGHVVDRTIALTYNDIIEIVVVSESGGLNTYTLNLKRLISAEGLRNLTVLGTTYTYDPDKAIFTIEVPNNQTNVKFNYELCKNCTSEHFYSEGLEEGETVIDEVYGSLAVVEGLRVGENTITVKVELGDGSIKDYIIKILRTGYGSSGESTEDDKKEENFNGEKVEVPDAGDKIPKYVWIVGGTLVVIGIGVIIRIVKGNYKKTTKKENSEQI